MYNTENYLIYSISVINHKGKEYKKECKYVYNSYFVVQQRLAQHCKSIMKVRVLVAQSCPILYDPMDCSPPASSVRGILQARILEWVAIPFFRGSSWPRNGTQISHIAGRFFTVWATRKNEKKKKKPEN